MAELRKMEAFTDIDIDEAQVGAKIRQTREWNKLAQENLAGTGHITEDLKDREADRGIKVSKADTENKVSVKVPFLGAVPLDTEIRIGGDEGKPIVIANPASPIAKVFMEIAKETAAIVANTLAAKDAEAIV